MFSESQTTLKFVIRTSKSPCTGVGSKTPEFGAPLVADLFFFCYERDFMLSLSDNNQTDIIEAFNSTSRYLDDLLNIDNPYF